MSEKIVLSVGQCAADAPNIKRELEKNLPVLLEECDTADEAVAKLQAGGYDLVLVNRVFDADGGSGLELIKRIKADDALKKVPVMLVSNHANAQQQAAAAGAVAGFGKDALGTPEVVERVKAALPQPADGGR